jgi:D-alanyl-D-alanine carboxypeptidase
MKRSLLITVILVLLPVIMPLSAYAHHVEKPPEISTGAEAAALIDVASGRILYSHRGDEPMLIASLTKIMTAIVAIEYGELTDVIRVQRSAVGKEGSSIYLKEGQEMTLHHMLYGLMLRSGNDAATAIAEHVGGTEQGFVYMMNQKAEELGLKNTSFKNPHGLDAEGHYSSANDLAKLTAYALRNPVFREIVSTKVKRVPNPGEKWDHIWYNKNKMLSLYEGADGVKTGYTKAAGRGLVSSATRDGRQMAAVTINDGNDWLDHARLLDWGFRYFATQRLIAEGETVEDTPYVAGRSFYYPLYEGEIGHVTHEVVLEQKDSVDYRLGVRGRLNFYLDGTFIGSVPLVDKPEQPGFSHERQPDEGGGYLRTLRSLFLKMFTLR